MMHLMFLMMTLVRHKDNDVEIKLVNGRPNGILVEAVGSKDVTILMSMNSGKSQSNLFINWSQLFIQSSGLTINN